MSECSMYLVRIVPFGESQKEYIDFSTEYEDKKGNI